MTELAHRPSHGINVQIDQGKVLEHLGIDANDPAAHALVLTCQRYGLDPILKHALLIEKRLYVTRDGLLHVAHNSGQLDGIEVQEQSETDSHFIARVAVYRKDMSRPFVYVGRFPKMRDKYEWEGPYGQRRKKKTGEELHPYGPEMAVKCAEVMALRRAFDVAIAAAEEIWDSEEVQQQVTKASGEAGPTTEVRQDPSPPSGSSATSPASSAPPGDGAHNKDVLGTSAPPVGSDAEREQLELDRPCPACGYECRPSNASNDRAPKFFCTNDKCTGHLDSRSSKRVPWRSWSVHPWSPGSDYDKFQKAASESSGHGASQPAPDAAPPSGSLTDRLASLCTTKRDQNRALSHAVSMAMQAGVAPPGGFAQIEEALPPELFEKFLEEVAAKLAGGGGKGEGVEDGAVPDSDRTSSSEPPSGSPTPEAVGS